VRAAPGVANGKKKARGIWQYTESGLLAGGEQDEDDGEVEEDPLFRVLEGKTKCVGSPSSDYGVATRRLTEDQK